jgi:ParB family transcriptional regulator, chromosome partitioning protein
MAAKIGLGRGLDALMGDAVTEAAVEQHSGAETELSLDSIQANPDQPRRNFDADALQELADSIREHGIIQPVIVEKHEGSYRIVAGERRTRAARIAGLSKIPVIIRNYTDERRLEVALIENVQRQDLDPMEEASAYKRLMDMSKLSQEELSLRVGKNRSTIANSLRLLKLPEDIQRAISGGDLSPGHARALLAVLNPADQTLLFNKIVEEGLSVREAEKIAAELNKGSRAASNKPEKKAEKALDPELSAIQQKLIDTLGTKVSISGTLSKGHLTIDYYSMDDLDRLYRIIARD